MEIITRSFSKFLFALCVLVAGTVNAQTTLLTENFGTTGTLPTGWTSSNTTNGWSNSTVSVSSGYTGASGNANAIFNNTGALNTTHTLTYSNSLSTVGYSNITVLWGARASSASFNGTISFQWSSDGTTWNNVTYTNVAFNGSWALVNGGTRISLPAGAAGQANLRFRFNGTTPNTTVAGNFRIDDFTVQGTAAPVQNGVIGTNEYGTHTDGNNQQTSGTTVTYMTWDNTNLYVGVSAANRAEAYVLYLDKDPQALVNGGTNANGTNVGFNYDGTSFAALQFRADLVLYVKDNYREYRTADGSNGWSAQTSAFGSYADNGSNVREFSIPWSAIGGRPTSFNWFGYVTSSGGFVYGQVPTENAGGSIGTGARYGRYYTVSTTTVGSSTPPFSRNSYVFNSTSDDNAFGPIAVWDFTMNSSGRQISRTGGAAGAWTIGGNLNVGAGSIYLGNTSAANAVNVAGNLNISGGLYSLDTSTSSTTVTGNVNLSAGTLQLSSSVGGDLNLVGNWNYTGGTFTPASRQVSFNGTTAQTLTGANTFDFFRINNTNGLTLNSSITVNSTLTFTAGKITLGSNNLTLGASASTSGQSSTAYVATTGTGQLKRTVGGSSVLFPVGNSAYNPITLNNTGGTSDVYGINVLDGTFTVNDATKIINRRWQLSEAVAGGSNLTVVAQYNTGEQGSGFNAASNPNVGFYNGSSWQIQSATLAGANPFTATTSTAHTPSDVTSGTQYFGVGKDNGLAVQAATKFVITAITPSTPTAGKTFSVTVQSQNAAGVPTNVTQDTDFYFDTNGLAGDLTGGTQNDVIASGTNTKVVTGVLLPTAATGVTITAIGFSGDPLTDGVSAPFEVGAPASQLAFVGFPSSGTVGSAVTSFTVEARRPNGSVDTSYTGNIVLSKATGPGGVSGTLTVAASAGVATFSTVQFGAAGSYTLNANSTGLAQATSSIITITAVPVTIWTNPITGTDPGLTSPYTTGQTFDTNISVSGISRGSGLTGNAGSNRYNATAWTTAGSVDANDYFEFTLTANTGYEIDFSSFTYTGQVSSGTPSFAFRSSKDSYVSNIGSPATAGATISLSGASYQNVTGSITFRLYGFSMASGATYSVNDFTFSGNVFCIQPDLYNVTGGGTYCSSNPSGVAVGLSGSQVGISYQLKRNGTNVDSPIAGTGSAISFLNQTVAGTYTVEAFNPTGSCSGLNLMMTGSVSVSVDAAPTAGSISGGGGTVCAGTNSTGLTLSGHSGTIQWQSSSDNTTFTNISGATSTTYTATNITSTTYYRAVVSNGVCTPVNTTSVVINVDPVSVAGTIGGATTVCTGTNSTNLTVSGHTGSIQWQASSDNSTFTNISGETGTTYTATNLTATTYYRVVVTSGVCSSATSASVAITVSPASVAGTISGGGGTVCSGTNSTNLTLSGHTGSIQWQSSPDNTTFTDISGETGTTYTATNLTVTTYYRAVVTSAPCSSATTGSVTITVNPTSVAGSIGGATTVCTGTNSTNLTLSGHTGSIQWQSSLDNTTFTNISGETGTTYTATNLTATTYYRAVVTSAPCSAATTASVTITVNPASVAGTISGGGGTVCTGTNNTNLTLSGHTGSIQWQSSPDNTTFTDISGETGTSYSATNLTATTYYRVVVTNSSCAADTSASVVVNVSSAAVAGTISGGGTFCGGGNTTLTVSGYTGSIQWQSSSDDITFTNIGGETNATYNATISGTMYYRVVVTNGACTDISASVSVAGGTATTWNGSAWSNGSPTSSSAVTFAGNYTAAADLSACSITVTSGAIVIPSGFDVSLNGALTVTGGSFTLENNANLLQTTNASNSGNIIVKRNSSAVRRQDYTLWSSPVASQGLLAFSPLTVTSPTSRFYQYNSSTNQYNSITTPGSTNFAAAQGYLIRVANNHPTFPWIWNGQFTGVPHNGNYNFTLYNGGNGNRFNLVGNPYPSPISAASFVSANSSDITGTLYFWRETNGNLNNNPYCTWSPAGGGTFVTNGEASVIDPQGIIQTGQGFFVEASATGSAVSFTNAMRVGNNANQFFRPAGVASVASENAKVWLNVTSDAGAFCQTAVVYTEEATNGYEEGVDARSILIANTGLYSQVDGQKLGIQGRALPFDVTDVVPLVFNTNTAGTYNITIDHVDGLFTAGQNIYLKDNALGTQHLLNNGAYSFTTETGEFASRFEIVYQAALGTANPTLEGSVNIIKTNGAFVINSGLTTMDNVKVFDIRGRLLAELKDVNASQATFTVGEANQVLIVKITSVDGQTATRKVMN
ncbi:hypothetical protein FLLO111716_08895 [Flavobacterium longum]|uniref:T9SS sorting signal type C domain-containing protein n=1 Tax=Flavobacterium longum TaxID=1299340 RepID=UPI0039EB6D95